MFTVVAVIFTNGIYYMSNQALFEELAKLILYHRKKSGLSRLELALLAGVGKTVVFDLEHAKKTVQLDTLVKIFEVLNITIEFKSPLMQIYKETLNEKR